jgi:hypothetical protein
MVTTAFAKENTIACLFIPRIENKDVNIKIKKYVYIVTSICTDARVDIFEN